MTTRDEALAAARAAARSLTAAVSALQQHFGDSRDLRRLDLDVRRLEEDLDHFAGPPAVPSPPGGANSQLEVIPDEDYPADFFADAEDEGQRPS